jgi:polysaccharide biosynthesis/export protein
MTFAWGRTMRWVATRLAAALLVGGVAAGTSVSAQQPTPAQMEAFRNLPADQQQAILESMGMSGTESGITRSDTRLETPVTVRPRPLEAETERGMTAEGEPRLAAGDTLIVELELPKFEGQDRVLTERPNPPSTEPTGQAVTSPGADNRAPAATPQRTMQTPTPQTPSREIVRTDAERENLERLIETVRRGNPYRLDATGAIDLPGLGVTHLAGLTAYQATQRLAIEPYLREYLIRLTFLPLDPVGSAALKPFGYDLFAGVPSTYAPVSDVPVPSEYVVGPGDRIEVQLIGNSKGRYLLTVTRDGRINLPELGPVAVAGMRFEEARQRIEQRVKEQMIGTEAVVTMGDLRSIRVFVLGEAERPGSYTVSGLATITNALFASGGVKTIGSLRNIQLKRNGKLVRRLDLYDLLLKGDTSGDVRLLPGDVIFIPSVGSTVGVTGAIRRPAIYELRGETTAGELLYLGGGLTPEATPALARIERISRGQDRVVVDVDLSGDEGRGTRLSSGDVLTIPEALPNYANAVRLAGHVHRPSVNQYRNGMRLTDLIPSIEGLKTNADLHYVVIRREQSGTRRIQVISADLEQAWRAPMTDANPRLAARDEVIVFDLETGRDQYLAPVIEELKLQATSNEPSRIVSVSGQVRIPGEYPLEPGMTVSDLVRAGGGLDERALDGSAELARYEVIDGQSRRAEVLQVDLARVRAGDVTADLPLRAFDTLVIKEISEWSQQEFVRLEGEVKFPGRYPIARGETLRSVVARAGGLTQLAFANGSVFTREFLKERERQQMKVLADRLRQDLGTLALQSAQSSGPAAGGASDTLAIGQSLLADLENTEPVGRLVIDLDRVLAAEPGSTSDLIMRDGDLLRVPKRAQEVTVIGEVQSPTSHLFDPALTRDDYLRLSGGTNQKADEKRIYVVRANGSVETGSGSRWFRTEGAIQPGDTIVVPLDAERMRPLPLWTAVTTILYNIAVAVAAVNSF